MSDLHTEAAELEAAIESFHQWRASVDKRLDAIEKRLDAKKRANRKPPEGYSEGFEVFWRICWRPESKVAAYKRWKQHRCDAIANLIIDRATAYGEYVKDREPKFKPLPATWLNQKQWETDWGALVKKEKEGRF